MVPTKKSVIEALEARIIEEGTEASLYYYKPEIYNAGILAAIRTIRNVPWK